MQATMDGRESERADITECREDVGRKRGAAGSSREGNENNEGRERKCRESTVERRTRVRQLCGH